MTLEQLTAKINAMDPADDEYNALCALWESIDAGEEFDDAGDLPDPININKG